MVEIDPEKLDKVGPDCSWIGPHQLNKVSDVVNGAYCGEVIRECGFSKEPKVGVPRLVMIVLFTLYRFVKVVWVLVLSAALALPVDH